MHHRMSAHIGSELKKIRESKGLTLEQAADDTCLRAGFLRELEESSTPDDLPDVYRRLSLKMYARYLGMQVETTRRAVATDEGTRIAPVGLFVRRMGRPVKASPRINAGPKNRLLSVVKTAGAAVVAVLAVGLWSLNAKLARLGPEEERPHPPLVVQPEAPPPSLQLVVHLPHCSLEEHLHFVLAPAAP